MLCCVVLCCVAKSALLRVCVCVSWHDINMTFNSVTLARTIKLPDDGPRTETCRSVFNVLMCKFDKFI